MTRARLRSVEPDEQPRRSEPKSISEALDGSGRDVLVAMRRALAKKLDDGEVSSNAIASAYKELRELDRLIRNADKVKREAFVDDENLDNTFDPAAI